MADLFKGIAEGFDRPIFFYFQELQRPWLDYFLGWPTRLGELRILLMLLILGILVLDKKRCPFSIPSGVIALLTAAWLSPLLKALFARPRPHLYWDNVHVIFNLPRDPAFPSGHTSLIFTAAFTVAHYYPKQAFWAYAIAVWVALTRLYVGVHYPTDLFGGVLLGAVCAFFAWSLMDLLDRSKDRLLDLNHS